MKIIWIANLVALIALPLAAQDLPQPAGATSGQLLLNNPTLSGNRGIACASGHYPTLAIADGVSLSLITGGQFHREVL